MSVRVSSWVWENSTVEHRGDLLVLLALADHAHDDGGGAYPSVATLARKARLSRRGVFDALDRLKRGGHIVADGTGPRGTVSYRLVMVQPLHRATAAPVQIAAPGDAVVAPEGVQPPAPEPSSKHPENRPSPPIPPLGGDDLAPVPPKGNRRRDRERWADEYEAFAAGVLPHFDAETAAVHVDSVVAEIGRNNATATRIRDWLAENRPELLDASSCSDDDVILGQVSTLSLLDRQNRERRLDRLGGTA